MTIKTRDFYNLSDDDFMRWSDEAAIWFTEHHADPNHAPMDLDFEPLATAFALALQDYKNKKDIAEARTREIAPASKQLRDLMLGLSRMLPTLFDGDENVLAEFSLTKPIPTDDDLLLVAARSCRDRWDVVKLEPEYAPLTFLFDQVAVLVLALEDARDAATVVAQARDAAQNAKDVALEAAVKKAQAIFNWYRGLYVSPEDERWQATPFGATYGEGESGGGTGTKWDAKPIAKIGKAPYPLNGITAGCEEYSGTTRFDFRIAWAPKGAGVPPMPDFDLWTDIEQPTLLDVELMFGYVYYVWIRACKEGEVSEWSDVASYEWNG